jgi:tRNA threonylcarbamoyladenosine biosynthesis protein TsaB
MRGRSDERLMLLALDTSTSQASLALVTADQALAEMTWNVGQRHSTELLQRLEWLLATAHVSTSQLDGVAVATGPGSFNGIRVALATAKSLGLALGIPLYGVPTLDVQAWGCALTEGLVWAILEAGRGQVYAAMYAAPVSIGTRAASWGPLGAYAVLAPEELARQVTEPVLFTGEWRPQTRGALEAALGARACFASPIGSRRAVWLAELALARAARGQYDEPAALEPLYLRRPAITTSSKLGLHQPATTPVPGDSTTEKGEASHALRG